MSKILPENVFVLNVEVNRKIQALVKRRYLAWRKKKGIPVRCDIPECALHEGPLEWSGRPIKMILDHASGNAADNTLGNLRLVCPNCNSQLETTGWSNVGRIERQSNGSYEVTFKRIKRKDAYVAGQILEERAHGLAAVIAARRESRLQQSTLKK